ncbi:hypothetical protein RI054_13g64420 [Pseudoscourfieldia marina]
MSSEDDATASQGGEDEFKDAAAQAEGEEKEEEKIPTPLPSPVSVEVLAGRLAALESGSTAAAEKIKELELSLLRERDARREAEVQLMQKQLAEATNSKGKEPKIEEETNWRKLEEYYDSLEYVPVSKFAHLNPFTSPDPRHCPANVERPQAFDLYGDRVADALEASKGSLRFEYSITEPLLYYLHGVVHFANTELYRVVTATDSTVEKRTRWLQATLNSLDRIHEWLAARNDIVKRLSGALGEHSDASLVKLLNSELYQRVAKRPPTSNWIEAIQSRFNDKRTDATLVALAKQQGQAQVAGSKATSTAKPPAKPTGGKGRPPPSKAPAHLGASLEKS